MYNLGLAIASCLLNEGGWQPAFAFAFAFASGPPVPA
jgi:hypothetical protein